MDPLETAKIKLIMELRSQGITDAAALKAIENTPREEFVAPAQRAQAYDNQPLPIGCAQTISQPYIVAFMTQHLRLGKSMVVLEIGTGSGYQAAVLSQLCRRVYTVERHRPLMREAEARFRELGLHNITTRVGDGYKGWPEAAPFDRIVVTAAAPEPPETLIAQLAVGGCMLIPVGPQWEGQQILRMTRTETGTETEALLPVRFVPMLPGVERGTGENGAGGGL